MLLNHNPLFICLMLCLFSIGTLSAQEGGIAGGCQDGIDNDGDGLIDCLDGDCAGVVAECPAFNITSMCSPSGGIRGDIVDIQTAFRNSSGAAVTFNIPAGATGALVYTSSTDLLTGSADIELGSEDFIMSSSVLNLTNQTSSGMITYAQSTMTNSMGTTLFGWKEVAFGNKVSTGAEAGHDFDTPSPPLNDITFSVSGSTLTITEDNTSIKTSYLVEFISPNSNSLVSEGFDALALNAGTFTGNVEIPTGTDFVIMTAKGTGVKDHSSASGGGEEPFSDMRIIIDLTSNEASGYVSVVNGGAAAYHSTYTFEGHDINSTVDSLWDAPTIAGDYTGKQRATDGSTSTANFIMYQTGAAPNMLEIARDPNYGADFDDVYVFEFFSRTGLPMASEFIETQLQFYDKGSPSGSSESFTVPSGSNYAIFKMGGLAENSNATHNENPVNAYAFIDLKNETVSGYYFQQVGLSGASRRDHNYAFQEVPMDNTSTRTHTNTIGKNSAAAQYDIRFDLSADKNTITVTSYFGLVPTFYKAVMIADFFGSRADLAFDASSITVTESGACPTVNVEIELCNPGAGNSPIGMPVAFYDGDPSTDVNAVLLDLGTFGTEVGVGQCATETIEVDLSALANKNIDLTIIINDDGSFANGVGNAIAQTFDLDTLDRQGNLFFECDYTNNMVIETISVNNCPVPTPDTIVTDKNEEIMVLAQANDSDPDGDNLITTILVGASNGIATVINSDSIFYRPASNYVGLDTIVYQLDDGKGGLSSDTIFITVTPTLPVELIYFRGEAIDCEVQLNWSVAIEEDFSNYVLERSTDGNRFEEYALIAALGGEGPIDYSYHDASPYRSNYYRLKMVDLDGSFVYSSVLSIEKDCADVNNMTVYPNPVQSHNLLTVKLYAHQREAKLSFMDVGGRVVKSLALGVENGENLIRLDVSDLPLGSYFLLNELDTSQVPVPFVKVR